MTNELQAIDKHNLQDKIHTIRGLQVMLDRDLAELYQVETRRLNEQVKRNIERFPEEFMFQFSKEEFENWKSQFATSNDKMSLRKIPYVFTEQGVSMLASVLKSKIAITISIQIIKAFVEMRKFISQNIIHYERFERIEQRLSLHDKNFDKLFEALEDKTKKPSEGIFFDGQIYDAYVFINDLLKSAKSEVVLMDNYIDDTVFTLFSKYPKLKIKIFTQSISKQLKLDFQKYKAQYANIELEEFKKAHDRFLIIDSTEIYHIGASLKDLGKKWFAFSKFEMEALEVLGRLK
ncbi:ORF6N domain-containing protein [Sulfurimonas sp.]|uniref:ORF6N domain-containing protein n=1 Tax=Sulfurimonas sp. TaxID=2022749 RepID=UPI0025FE235A|nr:ORF6N domain-containing protein [Sulfurimonas sp.]MDD5157462.1 ORF6N domain-containing protein [Sulfurimonas sp.]